MLFRSIAATGPLGGAAGGLRALMDGPPITEARRRLVERHMRPRPRLEAGGAAIAAGIRCAIDISDGLVQDLMHVCVASDAAAELSLDRIPLDAELVAVYPVDAGTMALTGGEDYELILVGGDPAIAVASSNLSAPLIVIGRIVAGDPEVRVLDSNGEIVPLAAGGWDHLAQGRPA